MESHWKVFVTDIPQNNIRKTELKTATVSATHVHTANKFFSVYILRNRTQNKRNLYPPLCDFVALVVVVFFDLCQDQFQCSSFSFYYFLSYLIFFSLSFVAYHQKITIKLFMFTTQDIFSKSVH